jgi:NhaP-type Na+/H+ or K+/H+ antiporter
MTPRDEAFRITSTEFGGFLLSLLGRALLVSLLVPAITLTGALLFGA